ncbi:hypothetical protein [Caldisericum exile]|uniref:Uncharacterized protein n=1 Tax=Caldisericum exile (strain DSM 21853 / NBRC 104410 / AZM16c01) TaxID=511051 RepID=A0A7U6GE52_CALEA|nr:hypothetical protein [Caldisericum exile]BAL80716.1 hypothetical protein CSE_05900 [Caldisericum exile AZM16c01]
MTKASKIILAVYFFFLALVAIIVPWKVNQAIAQGTVLVNSIGYAPIWSVRGVSSNYEALTVDFGRVILEIIALTALFAIPFIFTLNTDEEEYEYVELEDFVDDEEENNKDIEQ